jgi:hypothetical protein
MPVATIQKGGAIMKEDYVPFGPEWEAELMKWKKIDIIRLLKERCISTSSAAGNHGAQPAHPPTAPCQNNGASRNHFSIKAVTSA